MIEGIDRIIASSHPHERYQEALLSTAW